MESGEFVKAGRFLTAAFLFLGGGVSTFAQQAAPRNAIPAAQQGGPRATEKPAAAPRFAERVDALFAAEPVNKAEWGLLIVDAASGETLFQQNSDHFFVPASNMKLLTTALALDTLGPDYRFHTTVETSGTLGKNGVLSGELILVGRGDPNLSNRKFPYTNKEEFEGPPEKALAELADKLVAAGLKEVKGDVIGDDSYFPRERYPDGWEIDDMVWEYGAAVSALVVNDNTVTLTLTAGEKPGDTATIAMLPFTSEFQVQNLVTTSAASEKADLRLTREPGANLVIVSGTYPARSKPRDMILAVQEPAQFAAEMLARLLTERGVIVKGKVRAMHEPDPTAPSRTVLAEHISLPLSDAVRVVNKVSQNLHTEVLLRTSARQSGVWATPEDLAKFPEAFYAKAGVKPGEIVQSDGSGLSRHDMVTPRAFVAVLQYAAKQPWFNVYFSSLPVAGQDGTLSERMKNPSVVGKIHAKTGSVTHVRSLSGYAETPSGRQLVFSLLTNNQNAKNKDVHNAMDGVIEAMMEEFDAPPAPYKNVN